MHFTDHTANNSNAQNTDRSHTDTNSISDSRTIAVHSDNSPSDLVQHLVASDYTPADPASGSVISEYYPGADPGTNSDNHNSPTRSTWEDDDILHALHPQLELHDPSDHLSPSPSASSVPTTTPKLSSQTPKLLRIYDAVRTTGLPNFLRAKIPLPHGLNLTNWARYLPVYKDPLLSQFLAYGFPANYQSSVRPVPTNKHHTSALTFPEDINHYLATELSQGALSGPFTTKPFTWIQTSPLMTREKKNSTHRRVILNLSAPNDLSVNSGIPTESYLGIPFKLKLPSARDFKALIIQHGPGCLLWSHDLSRGYRQLRSDPLDWPLLGIQWQGKYYFDCSIPFGLRFGAKCMQDTTSAVATILQHEGFPTLAYIDDLAGVHQDPVTANKGFLRTRLLLHELGLQEARDKATTPSTSMTWLGIHFDTVAMTMSIPPEKIHECLTITRSWTSKSTVTHAQLRSLLGKLFHVSQCSPTLRLFVNRLLDTLRSSPKDNRSIALDSEAQADITWINQFLSHYNGVQLIHSAPSLGIPVVLDSCLTGAGGHFGKLAFHTPYPPHITDMNLHITQLEMINIMAAVRLWAHLWSGHSLLILCDNAAAVSVLQTGRGRDPTLLHCAHIIWSYSAAYDFRITVEHIPGTDNGLADSLSRYHTHPTHKEIVDNLVLKHQLHICSVDSSIFSLNPDAFPILETTPQQTSAHK